MSKSIRMFALFSIAFAMLSTFASGVRAEDGMFSVSVKHNINGRSLGLSKELPVIADIWTADGVNVASIPLEFKDIFEGSLPAGTYVITVTSVELGVEIESMRLGPVAIPEGADISIMARLSGGKTPILDVKN